MLVRRSRQGLAKLSGHLFLNLEGLSVPAGQVWGIYTTLFATSSSPILITLRILPSMTEDSRAAFLPAASKYSQGNRHHYKYLSECSNSCLTKMPHCSLLPCPRLVDLWFLLLSYSDSGHSAAFGDCLWFYSIISRKGKMHLKSTHTLYPSSSDVSFRESKNKHQIERKMILNKNPV